MRYFLKTANFGRWIRHIEGTGLKYLPTVLSPAQQAENLVTTKVNLLKNKLAGPGNEISLKEFFDPVSRSVGQQLKHGKLKNVQEFVTNLNKELIKRDPEFLRFIKENPNKQFTLTISRGGTPETLKMPFSEIGNLF